MSTRFWQIACVVVFALTVVQLAAGAFLDLEQFEGKAFGARLLWYPIMMLTVPVAWWAVARYRKISSAIPWDATAILMVPFLTDVTGNTLDLFDRINWWDDLMHFGNWFILAVGVGLLLLRGARLPGWALVLLIWGLGALLAIWWEAAEWWAFIRHGTELETAYEDTLLDEVLGSTGSLVAGLVVAWWANRRSPTTGSD